jgi:hypothetical protein
MFKAPAEYGIEIIHLTTATGDEAARELDQATKTAINNPNCEAVAFVFNRDFSLDQYAAMLRSLGGRRGWFLREETISFKNERYTVVGLDVSVGSDGDEPALSELVGFGPFEYLPVTRRAPVPAIVLRTKSAFSLEPLPNRSERRANLAAIRMPIDTNAFNALWTKSQALRAELDGRDNPMARARVALAIPASIWSAGLNKPVERESNAQTSS